jgi:hypothetical protein
MQLYGVVWFSSPLRHATSEVVTAGGPLGAHLVRLNKLVFFKTNLFS